MSEKDLIPMNKRTKAEAKELSRLGGIKSGIVRNQKKDMRAMLKMLVELPISLDNGKNICKKLGITDKSDLTNQMLLNVALFQKASQGDTQAYGKILEVIDDIDNKQTDGKEEFKGIPSNMIAPAFASLVYEIEDNVYSEYVLQGGRGSAKSSFISLMIISILYKNEDIHACIMRQVGDTLRTSVFPQILWSIQVLGLESEFKTTVSPLEITRIKTGQKIYFRGADDPGKLKSIKTPFGYIGVEWFEELDQFEGEESVRKIEQSLIRGGDINYNFKSFNPPKSANNWANKYVKMPKEQRTVVKSDFITVPKKWLGKIFLEDAEYLKAVNPKAYENEYLGVANGTGGNVFDNVVIREIEDKEIEEFDRVYNGVDWGWYPDPFVFTKVYYNSANATLFIFEEFKTNKMSNRETADVLLKSYIDTDEVVTCDSAEPKSVGDYKSYGIIARGAKKGAGSVNYSVKWLQSLKSIIIDNKRCPTATNEFLNYEYLRDKEGNVITGYPDINNHAIDSVRYATNEIWTKRGE